MPMTAHDILEAARQLPLDEQQRLLKGLLEEEEAAWRKELGEPEVGYREWFTERVTKSLTVPGPAISTEEAMLRARNAILQAGRMKQSA